MYRILLSLCVSWAISLYSSSAQTGFEKNSVLKQDVEQIQSSLLEIKAELKKRVLEKRKIEHRRRERIQRIERELLRQQKEEAERNRIDIKIDSLILEPVKVEFDSIMQNNFPIFIKDSILYTNVSYKN